MFDRILDLTCFIASGSFIALGAVTALFRPSYFQKQLLRLNALYPDWWPLKDFHRMFLEDAWGLWTIRIAYGIGFIIIFKEWLEIFLKFLAK